MHHLFLWSAWTFRIFSPAAASHQFPLPLRALSNRYNRAQKQRPKDQRERTRSEEHTSELQSQSNLVCRLLLEKKTRSPSCSETSPGTKNTSLRVRGGQRTIRRSSRAVGRRNSLRRRRVRDTNLAVHLRYLHLL